AFLREYWKSTDAEIVTLLLRMHFERLASPLDGSSDDSNAAVSYWRFDTDKICCLVQLRDSCDGYSGDTPWQEYSGEALAYALGERISRVHTDLAGFRGKLFFLVLGVPIGRRAPVRLPAVPEHVSLLYLSSNELSTIVGQGDADNLTL